MKKAKLYISGLLFLILQFSCQDDWDNMLIDDGLAEGEISFSINTSETNQIYTRSGDDDIIENVMLLVFNGVDASGDSIIVNRAYQTLLEGNNTLRVYMTADPGQVIYALCNLPEETVANMENVKTLSQLKGIAIKINTPDGAYSGKFVMSGSLPIELQNGKLKPDYEIYVKRLAAKFDFKIRFNPPSNSQDRFLISGIYMHNIPMGSYLVEKPVDNDETAGDDYAFGNEEYYLEGTEKDSVWVDYEEIYDTSHGTGIVDTYYGASYYLYENRRGAASDEGNYWDDLNGLKNLESVDVGGTIIQVPAGYKNLYEYYRQTKKWKVAEEMNLLNTASYLTIHGVYTKMVRTKETAYNVAYTVFLGKDNYKDFNVVRNTHYVYDISIKDMDRTDTRVYSDAIADIAIYGNTETILDAHPNVLQLLLYSAKDWKLRVKDPDQTPWLELSKSSVYKPRMMGQSNTDGIYASFSMSGSRGLQYFYVHTDEYVPKMEKPTLIEPDFREGTIVCESNNMTQEITIRQYAAQMVVCHIKYDIHTMEEIRDTFYVERVLEKKNLSWGFVGYWSFIMDDLIAAGQWDGLANTRRLYETATKGDKWNIEPAYPPENYPNGVPTDIALGYAIQKNRDRNGNGKIDYNEILWYMPAANELQAVYGHKTPGLSQDDCDKIYMDVENCGKIELPLDVNGNFHSSSPSVSDAGGITGGRSYYVNMSDGTKAIGLRSRYYNVLCARRADGWLGPETGETDGNVDNDEDWNDDEEEIMDKNKGE